MIITQTPLRISFAGGGTDMAEFYRVEEGGVISAAIDKYVFVIVNERFDSKIYVNYSNKEIVNEVDEIQHELVREAMRKAGVKGGVEITMLADIPSEGSGLGSSSSVTVGLLNALYMIKGVQVTAETLARDACDIEINICGKPIGKQDQYIAAYGGIKQFIFKENEEVETTPINLMPGDFRNLSLELMLFYTGVTRKADVILEQQKSNVNDKIDYLRKIRRYVPQVKNALDSKQFSLIGDILNEGWLAKKNLASNISNKEIDDMYEMAVTAGAVGGKIAGAGGGGFLLLYVPKNKQDAVRNALKDYREFPTMLEQDGSKVIFNLKRYPAR